MAAVNGIGEGYFPYDNSWPASLVIVLSAMAASAGLIIVLRPWLVRYALARPNARSSHKEPTPQGGGIAVCAATIGAVLLAVMLRLAGGAEAAGLLPMLLAAALLAIVGAVDDIHPLAVGPRLVLQALAVAVMIFALPAELRVAPQLPWWVERAFLLVGSLWFVNLVNFMDGIDWMTVAEVAPVTIGLILIGIIGALPSDCTLVAMALLGAVLGFAPFNRPVAKLFLGDVGSLPIGLILAWLLIALAGHGHLTAALLLPLYYVADATITVVRRFSAGERFWEAHRTHFYQRAGDNGYSVPQVVGRVLLINVCLVGLAVGSVLTTSILVSLIALAVGAALVSYLLISFARCAQRATPASGTG